MVPPRPSAAPAPLDERDLATLQTLLDALPAPLVPLDVGMIDGYLCGVLVQPRRVPEALAAARARCRRRGAVPRPLPPGFDVAPLVALVRRRHAELDAAIARRDWFDLVGVRRPTPMPTMLTTTMGRAPAPPHRCGRTLGGRLRVRAGAAFRV